MNYSAFERKFGPIEDMFQNYGCDDTRAMYAEITSRKIPANLVWSITIGDNGEDWYVGPGFHVVNMMGYVISTKPWTDADLNDGLVVKY